MLNLITIRFTFFFLFSIWPRVNHVDFELHQNENNQHALYYCNIEFCCIPNMFCCTLLFGPF